MFDSYNSDSSSYNSTTDDDYLPYGPVPMSPGLGPGISAIPIPLTEDPRSRYTFREMLVNNGIPYDGRDYVTRHRNDLILDGFFDDGIRPKRDHREVCPYRSGMVNYCAHPSHRVQVTSGIPDMTGRRHPITRSYVSNACSSECHENQQRSMTSHCNNRLTTCNKQSEMQTQTKIKPQTVTCSRPSIQTPITIIAKPPVNIKKILANNCSSRLNIGQKCSNTVRNCNKHCIQSKS